MCSQKSEDNLGSTEAELEKQSNKNAELQRKVSPNITHPESYSSFSATQVDDLQVQANLASKLKDQVDE